MDEELFEGGLSVEEAFEARMKRTEAEETPPEDDETETPEDQSEEDTSEDEGEAEEEDTSEDDSEEDEGEEEEAVEEAVADPEAFREIKVGDEVKRVKVKDLERLYGQEASLTQKSQNLATQREAVEAQGMVAAKLLDGELEKARALVEKYKTVDLNSPEARDLSQDEYVALRDTINNAKSNLAYLESAGADFVKEVHTNRQKMLKAQAQASLKEITDPQSRFHIPEWSNEHYDALRTFAVNTGIPANTINEMVDPGLTKVLHMAYQYAQAAKTKETAKAKVKQKVAKAPNKTLKSSGPTNATSSTNLQKLKALAESTGDLEDILAYKAAKLKATEE